MIKFENGMTRLTRLCR